MNAIVKLAPQQPVDQQTAYRIQSFLLREARLLDTEAWDEWLALMADDIHYWMPAIENRRRIDKLKAYEPGRGAYFDDNREDLGRRVARFKQPSAWAEDPPTRHIHVVTNIEAFPSDAPGEYRVYSAFVNYRSRGEADNDMLLGRREDVLREIDGDFRIARRLVLITQSLLLSKNLNTFF
jgi:ethylbenzene dioxygenase beta subunit